MSHTVLFAGGIGITPMLNMAYALEQSNASWELHLERFGAEVNTDGASFTVIAHKSGKQFDVHPGETIALKLTSNGIDVQVSCQSRQS